MIRSLALFAALWLAPATVIAEPSAWLACHQELAYAANRHHVPYRILEAVAAAESGREGNGYFWPWPWTVNVEGKARYFSTRAEALDRARSAMARGISNIDLGCMQISWRYHGAQFSDLDAALEPRANVDYAAHLLAAERRHSFSWSDAVSRYHSRHPDRAAKYRCLVASRLSRDAHPVGCPVTRRSSDPERE